MASSSNNQYDQLGYSVTLPASAAFIAASTQNTILAMGSDGTVGPAGLYGAGFIGVNRLPPFGQKVVTWNSNIVGIWSSTAITAGQKITSDAVGMALPYTSSSSGATFVTHVGTALTSATGSGILVSVLLNVGAVAVI